VQKFAQKNKKKHISFKHILGCEDFLAAFVYFNKKKLFDFFFFFFEKIK
jgi:hypothetical protein